MIKIHSANDKYVWRGAIWVEISEISFTSQGEVVAEDNNIEQVMDWTENEGLHGVEGGQF